MLRRLVPRPLKQLLKRLVHLPERALHPWRRRRARDELADAIPEADSVMFVCYGNICRSPFAERYFAESLPEGMRDGLRIESSGFHAEEDRPSPTEAVRAAARVGIDLTGHSSSSLLSGLDRDLEALSPIVFVMEPDQGRRFQRTFQGSPRGVFVLGDFDPKPVDRRRIRDPFGAAPGVFAEVFERIQRCSDEIAAIWQRDESRIGGSEAR